MLKKVSSVVSRQTKANPCSKLTLPGQKMSTRLALKKVTNTLYFIFPWTTPWKRQGQVKLSRVWQKSNKEGSMVEVNWDAANPCIPAKIIPLAGKCYCFRYKVLHCF